MATSTNRGQQREWLAIIAIALLLHVALFLLIKPGFFAAFKKNLSTSEIAGSSQPGLPHAIIVIPIEIDDLSEEQNEQEPVQEPVEVTVAEADEKKPEPTEKTTPAQSKGTENPSTPNIDGLASSSPATLPSNFGSEPVVIPPRPIEITWPDTKNIKDCLGQHIDMEIEVSYEGKIMNVRPSSENHPRVCLDAAIKSAKNITFEPGTKDGRPTTLWTKVRIEFRLKN